MHTTDARVTRGARIAVVSPSGPSPIEHVLRGVARLSTRYDVRLDPRATQRSGYLAGTDEDRAQSLLDALEDREVRAIVCARGGYGATRVIERRGPAILAALARDPKPIVGFSDVTALHVLWERAGVRSVHAPMVARLGVEGALDDALFERWCAVLEGREHALASRGADGARAQGASTGGNLAVLAAMVGTDFTPQFRDRIVFLEDVGERPYRVDRMLTQLRAGRCFDGARGVVLGEFTDCGPGPDGQTVEAALSEGLAALGIPVWTGAPFGHGDRCEPFALGEAVTILGDGVVRWRAQL